MKLLTLPAELLLIVSDNLRPKELNSLLRTNRYLHSLLTPLLHKIALQDIGTTPALTWAANSGHESLARLILSTNGSLGIDTISGTAPSALHHAVIRGHEGIVRLLLENGASVDIRDKLGQTPLILTSNGRVDIARLLLDYGADVDAHHSSCVPGLTRAVWRQDVPMVRLLLQRGARITAGKDCSGVVLHGDFVRKHQGSTEAFLEIGGARNDHCRKNLLRWADSTGWGEIARTRYGLDNTIDATVETLDCGER